MNWPKSRREFKQRVENLKGGKTELGCTSAAANRKMHQVLDAGRDVFLREGYQGASMDAVCREVGGSKGTLYAYFSSKESLFAAVVTAECQRQTQILENLKIERLPIGLALRQIGMWFLDFLVRPDVVALQRVVVAEAHRFPELGRSFFESGPAKSRLLIAELLNRPEIRQELNIPNAEVAAIIFLSLIKGQLQLRSELGFSPASAAERTQWVDTVVDLFISAYNRTKQQ